MKKCIKHGLTNVAAKDVVATEAAAAGLLPWRPAVLHPRLTSDSVSEDSMSLEDETILAPLPSHDFDAATVVRRDFVSRWRSLPK